MSDSSSPSKHTLDRKKCYPRGPADTGGPITDTRSEQNLFPDLQPLETESHFVMTDQYLQKHVKARPTNGTIRCSCCQSNSNCSSPGYLDNVAKSENHTNDIRDKSSSNSRGVFQDKESIPKECTCQRRSLCSPSKHLIDYSENNGVLSGRTDLFIDCHSSGRMNPQCTCLPLNQGPKHINNCQTNHQNHRHISTNSFHEHNEYLSNQPNPNSVSRSDHSVCTCYIFDGKTFNRSLSENERDDTMLSQSVSLTSFFSASSTNSRSTEKPVIYITFSDKSKRHVREIKTFCKELKDILHFSVKCDNYDAIRESGELNILQWRDTNFFKALWIIFCISPDYSETLCKLDSDASESDKGILYIHKVSRAEVYNNGSRNHRIIPLLFTKSGATLQNIPCFLSFSPYYKYPKQKQELFERLLQY